jgi:Protein of unknown function (DUF742)
MTPDEGGRADRVVPVDAVTGRRTRAAGQELPLEAVAVGVARVLVGDLANGGYLEVHLPRAADGDGGPGQAIVGRLLDGLRSR